jgi:uncharacterized protein
MKYLLVLLVVVVALWLWRRNRREEMEEAARKTPPPTGAPRAMVRCAHCGLHLPAADAIAGAGADVYCSAAHRQAAMR